MENDDFAWENLLSSAARLQRILPEAVLVGGTASALHVKHRLSFDADHVIPNLREHFDEILQDLESVSGWETARIKRPVLILGKLDGIDTGIRQLIRKEPLETETIEILNDKITIPTIEEILRIKGSLILRRNATRDYLDFAVLADSMDENQICHAMQKFDSFYPQENGESALMQLQIQLAAPAPYDLDEINLKTYKYLREEWQNWEKIKSSCIQMSLILSAELERPFVTISIEEHCNSSLPDNITEHGNKLFHGNKEVGDITPEGRLENVQKEEGIEPILEHFPYYLRNSLPEGERYENLLTRISPSVESFSNIVKNLDEIPGNFTIGIPQRRIYTPVPEIPFGTVYAETTLPHNMFFVNSEIRHRQKPSFSGFQDKFTAKAVLQNGKLLVVQTETEKEYGNIIVKPGVKLPGVAQNEFVCMTLARETGIEVPRFFLLEHPDNKIAAKHFCVERFDFTDVPPYEKRDVLEFASMMNLTPENKYAARSEELFQCAERYLNASDLIKLSRAYFFGILTGNGDMHTKNFSVFVGADASYRLTPIYDMVNTQVHGFPDMLALPLNESCNPNPTLRSVIDFFKQYLDTNEMYKMAETIEQHLTDVLDSAFSRGEKSDGLLGRSEIKIRQDLEKSILSRTGIIKEIIEHTEIGHKRGETPQQNKQVIGVVIASKASLGMENMEKLRKAQKEGRSVQLEKANGEITVKAHEENQHENADCLISENKPTPDTARTKAPKPTQREI